MPSATTFSCSRQSRRVRLLRSSVPTQPVWPRFPETANYVGTSADWTVDVFVDAGLPQQAVANAQDVVAGAAQVVTQNAAIFGQPPQHCAVLLYALDGRTDGTGGADHGGCDYQSGSAIEVCVAYGNSPMCLALFEAELSECCMGGNLCGVSTGEALSRWCAGEINSSLAAFASAPIWAQDGFPNWVDQTNQTDTDYDSIGCGMAFISWLLSRGHDLPTIAQVMVRLGAGANLAQLWQTLESQSGSPWPAFLAACRAIPGGITSDDPFRGQTPPSPQPPAPQPPQPQPPAPQPGGLRRQTSQLFEALSKHFARHPVIVSLAKVQAQEWDHLFAKFPNG